MIIAEKKEKNIFFITYKKNFCVSFFHQEQKILHIEFQFLKGSLPIQLKSLHFPEVKDLPKILWKLLLFFFFLSVLVFFFSCSAFSFFPSFSLLLYFPSSPPFLFKAWFYLFSSNGRSVQWKLCGLLITES